MIFSLLYQHAQNEWCLCIDVSKVNVKAVLLHNGNKFPPVDLAHAADMRQSYENIKLLFKKDPT